MSTKYEYQKLVNPGKLADEIRENNTFTISLDYITTKIVESLDYVEIWFKDVLSGGEETSLTSLVTAHDPTPIVTMETVALEEGTIVTPTAPANEHNLRPIGMQHKHIDASTLCTTLTLSNKNNSTYTYSSSATPAYRDCITQAHAEVRDGVYEVDTANHTVTTFFGEVSNGEATLCKPVHLDYEVTSQYADINYLWGVFVNVKDFGEDDIIRFMIVDKLGFGVSAGWYTQAEFEAMGSLYVVKEYDECWVNQIADLKKLMTPDGAPGEIPAGLHLRASYYARDTTKTDIKVWIDYIMTFKSDDY